jgi:hypothetical protein
MKYLSLLSFCSRGLQLYINPGEYCHRGKEPQQFEFPNHGFFAVRRNTIS